MSRGSLKKDHPDPRLCRESIVLCAFSFSLDIQECFVQWKRQSGLCCVVEKPEPCFSPHEPWVYPPLLVTGHFLLVH